MDKVLIVGSGASGVHFALTLLQKGYQVLLLDVGREKPLSVNPGDAFNDLKKNLADPVRYFLGENFEAVVYPGSTGEYYGFPPNKNYVFDKLDNFTWAATGFAPLFSFARGGMAETWTGGVYPLNAEELKDFPFDYSEFAPYYDEVSRRIGISGAVDDLARFYPLHKHLLEPLRLDRQSSVLLEAYQRHKPYLNRELHCYLGRSRVATLTHDLNGRKACSYTGRCLWGCPSDAFYTPSITLRECLSFNNFTYLSNVYVRYFKVNRHGCIESMVVESLSSDKREEIRADTFVLAAGTLSSAKILLESIRRENGSNIKLTGLMDNRQILIPFINLNMIGCRYEAESYQYHQLAMGIVGEEPGEYYHALLTTLKTALVHPIVQNIPLDLRTALNVFRNVRAGLGVLNLNFGDCRRESNYVTLQVDENSGDSRLQINYLPPENESLILKRTVKTVKKALRKLGCIVPPFMMHVRPMGAGVHYAGTVPMSEHCAPLTTSKYGQSHDFENLYFADGSTFPALPAKNLTFALMANATRIADQQF
jgi:choline dehydrogenase-like flavoprotein